MAEPGSTVDAQLVDSWLSARFTWTIENFSQLKIKKLYSPVYYVGGYKWRVLIFPKGNNVNHLSVYLDVADSKTLPYGWSRYAQFSVAVVNQIHTKFTVRKDTQHQFDARESDWGFTSFMPLSELYDPCRGYLRNDTFVVEADITHINDRSLDSIKVVRFRSLGNPKEDEFILELSKLCNYDDVVKRVAQHLGLDDPSKIRLTSHNCYSNRPKTQPIKYRGLAYLSDMLVHYNQTSDILYYEVLDIPLQELQSLKTLKIAFHHATEAEVVIHTIRLSKQSTVGDVISDLKTKVKLSHPNAEVRLLEIFHHKIYKIFGLGENIENVNDQYWTLRAEEIPEEEKEIGPQDLLIHVYHFMDTVQNQMVQNFGEPFLLVIHEGETVAEVKVRVQKKLQVPDEEFSKWKLAFLSMGRPEYLQDTDIMLTCFQRKDVHGPSEQYLGLEHSDNPPKLSHSVNQLHDLAIGHGVQVIEASAEAEVNNTEMTLEHEAQFIEASANTGHNTELAMGLVAEALEASTKAVADVQPDIMNDKVEPTGTVSFERKGTGCICKASGLKIINVEDVPTSVEDPESWRGFPVGKDHASLLHDAEVEHPDFFNDVKFSSARRAIQSLNLFASNLANLASDKHGKLSSDDLQVMRDELSDLERDGFRIRWAIESVNRVFTVRFQLPLQQEITELTAESSHLRGEIEHLQVKTASLKEEVTTLKEKVEHAEKELVVAEKEMGEAELRLNEIASELEARDRLLTEYNSILH